jgi:DNA gyrase subunit B
MAKVKPVKAKLDSAQDGFEIQEGLAGIRHSPGMYLGERGEDMAYRAVKEPVDNAYDESIAGRNKVIEVVLDFDNDLNIVADMAGGIPTDFKTLKSGQKETIMTAAFSRAHAGGKFNDKAYKTSAGTHGVGVAALNAVSNKLRVWSMYKGGCAYQSWEKGEVVSGKDPKQVKKVDADVASLLSEKKLSKYGTIVAWTLDQTVVSADVMRGKKLGKDYRHARPIPSQIAHWLKNMANLNPGLEIRFTLVSKKKRKSVVYINKKDLVSVVQGICEDLEVELLGKPFTFKNDNVTCTIAWTQGSDALNFSSFVNTSPTLDGGWHVVGFRDALIEALKPFMKQTKGKTKQTFASNDILIGLVGLYDWRMHGAQYTSQVKDKLASRVEKEVYDIMLKPLTEYFSKNKSLAKAIIKRATVAGTLREELNKTLKSISDVKKAGRSRLPIKLEEAPNCKPHERELYIVEGDSAGGSAKNARSRNQEILKLSGKIPNLLNVPLHKALSNDRIQDLILSLGADPKSLDIKSDNPTFNCDNLRVANVFILSDADPDGGHIDSLEISFFWKLFPDLIRQGRLYIVDAPLFNAVYKGKHYGGDTMEECYAAMDKDKAPRKLMFRAKGWGEVPADMLAVIAFDKDTRKLIRVQEDTDKKKLHTWQQFAGEEASARRRLLGIG